MQTSHLKKSKLPAYLKALYANRSRRVYQKYKKLSRYFYNMIYRSYKTHATTLNTLVDISQKCVRYNTTYNEQIARSHDPPHYFTCMACATCCLGSLIM